MFGKLLSTVLSAGISVGLLTAALWTLAPTSTMQVAARVEPVVEEATLVVPEVAPEPEWGLVVTPGPTS